MSDTNKLNTEYVNTGSDLQNMKIEFHVRVTVYNRYNNINTQLDVTIKNFIDNYNHLSMFQVTISPIFRSTRLCLQLVV